METKREKKDTSSVYECGNCGKQFKGEKKKCPKCGAELEYNETKEKSIGKMILRLVIFLIIMLFAFNMPNKWIEIICVFSYMIGPFIMWLSNGGDFEYQEGTKIVGKNSIIVAIIDTLLITTIMGTNSGGLFYVLGGHIARGFIFSLINRVFWIKSKPKKNKSKNKKKKEKQTLQETDNVRRCSECGMYVNENAITCSKCGSYLGQ